MMVNGKHYRSVWMEGSVVKMIDQRKLPFTFEIFESREWRETVLAIKKMVVRGAPAIGQAAAYAAVQACFGSKSKDEINSCFKEIKKARPTARNLSYAVERIWERIRGEEGIGEIRFAAGEEASIMASETIEACKNIGYYGSKLLDDGSRVLTHCNAGWLATVDYGTALSPVYIAKREGKDVFVWVDETRPRMQGAKLTAWELWNEGIKHKIIADNAAGFLMGRGMVDAVIVGADRIAINGDVANKIGTYEKAVVARENGIPFYVAAPLSTFDLKARSGKDIVIEERSGDEISTMYGKDEDGVLRRVIVSNEGSDVFNPAFDVTPAKYITGIITEHGVIRAKREDIKRVLK